jgi:hypothetical protein
MADAYQEFEAAQLFCPRCRRAVAVRKKLLLVLPTGVKYDYICGECGTAVGGKVDHDPTTFRETSRGAAAATPRTPPSGELFRRPRRRP